MAAAEQAVRPITTVRERLDAALVECVTTLADGDIGDVTVEAVARSAKVSRATAYRHFGDRDGLLFRAAVLLTGRHARAAAAVIARVPGVLQKVEEGFAYTAREVKRDRMLRLLLASRRSDGIDRVVTGLAMDISGAALSAGQHRGVVRTDLSVEQLVDWVVEQQYVVIRLELDEADVRTWVRRFIIPALRPQRANHRPAKRVGGLIAELRNRIDELSALLNDAGAQL